MNFLDFKQGLALFEVALTCNIVLIYLAQRLLKIDIVLSKRVIFSILLVCLLLLPFNIIGLPFELPLAAYLRGVTGELSIVTSLLLWSQFFSTQPIHSSPSFKIGVGLVGLFFYPCALGLGMIDPYAWGYGSVIFFTILVMLMLGMWLARWYRETVIVAAAILAWTFGLHESPNLWDYLLDPFLFAWCLVALLSRKARFAENMIK